MFDQLPIPDKYKETIEFDVAVELVKNFGYGESLHTNLSTWATVYNTSTQSETFMMTYAEEINAFNSVCARIDDLLAALIDTSEEDEYEDY